MRPPILCCAIEFCLLTGFTAAADKPDETKGPCPKTELVAMFPTAGYESNNSPKVRQRFELRVCTDGMGFKAIQVWGIASWAAKPSLVFDTGESWPRQIVQLENVLMIESTSPSYSFVYVFAFQHGRPRKVAESVTRGSAWVQHDEYKVYVHVDQESKPDRVIAVPIDYEVPAK